MGAHSEAPIWRKLAWFVGLWLAGVSVVAMVGLAIRFWLI